MSLTGPNRLNIRNDDSNDNDDNDDDDDDDDDRGAYGVPYKNPPPPQKAITYFAAEIKSGIVPSGVMVSPSFPRDALVARLLMPPVAQKLCRRELSLLEGRRRVQYLYFASKHFAAFDEAFSKALGQEFFSFLQLPDRLSAHPVSYKMCTKGKMAGA
jgi:hypothetical protein